MRDGNRDWKTLIEVFNRMKRLFLITDRCPLPTDPKSSPGRTGEFLPVVSGQDSVVSTQTARSIANRCHFPCLTIVSGFLLFVLFVPLSLTAQPARKKNAPPADAPITPEEAAKLEAVIKTELGMMRMEFYPDKAPLHVSSFIKNARAGVYDGTSFFRVFVQIGRAHV